MNNILLSEQNLLMESYRLYFNNNPRASISDFREDFGRCASVPKLLKLYKTKQKLNSRLLLNHIVILYNTFGTFATRLLFIKSDPAVHPELIALLRYFSRLPPDGSVQTLNGLTIRVHGVQESETLIPDIELELSRASKSDEDDQEDN